MAVIAIPNTFSANTTISSSQVNSNFSTIYNEFNGNIQAANLATDAVTTAKIADSNVTTAKINDSAVTTAKIADTNITYAKLLATIFSGQVSTVANSGNGGGTWSYINLGGIKIAWCIGTAATVNTNLTRVFVPPTSFFSAITFVDSGVATANNLVYDFVVSYATNSISMQMQSTTSMTATPEIFVIGS